MQCRRIRVLSSRTVPAQLRRVANDGVALIDPIERYGLVDDAWALTLAGRIRAAAFLELAEGFAAEVDVSVWQRLLGALDGITRALPASDPHRLDARVHALLAHARSRLGDHPRDGEPARTAELRGDAARSRRTARGTTPTRSATPCRSSAGPTPIRPSQPRPFTSQPRTATRSRFDTFVAAMRDASSPQEVERFRSALALFPGTSEMHRTIDFTLDGTIRSQDAPFVLRSLLRNRHQGVAAWQEITARWDDVRRVVPTNLVARLLEGIVALAEPGLADEVDAFVEAHAVPQGRTVIDQHRERLRVHTAFRRREREDSFR